MANRSGQRRRQASGRPKAKRPAGAPNRARFAAPAQRHGPLALTGQGTGGPLGGLSRVTGIPAWALVGGVLIWALMLLLWAGGATQGSFAIFLATLLCATMATASLAVSAAKGKEAYRAARAAVVVVLAAAVPVIFDPHTGDVFNLPKFTIAVIGALVLAGLWVVASVHRHALPRWRNGLQWVVGAIILWALITALTGMDTSVGLLGMYGSYDGFYSAAAFGVVMMSAADAFDLEGARKALSALAFGGGTVVAVYALIQLHDTEVSGPKWDFIDWHNGSFTANIFSTFGNPNHLAGFLAILLPIVLVFGLWAGRRLWQVGAGLLALLMLAELVRSSARGAWVATIASLAVLAAMLAPELKRRFLLTATSAAGVVVVAVVGMVVGGKRFISEPLSALFQSGGSSSVEQRLQIWKAAAHLATNHPLVGIGPDNLPLLYPRYESAAWVKTLGTGYLVNGGHDIFMNILADQGFVGLLLFLALLGYITVRSIGAWRRLRVLERGENDGSPETMRAQRLRATIAVIAASITAYVIQAAFNVQQVGLTFTFWVLVGCAAALTLAAGVPATLNPSVLVSKREIEVLSEEPSNTPIAVPAGRRGQSAWLARSGGRGSWQSSQWRNWPWRTVATAAAATAIVVVLSVLADFPYRADHDYWAAYTSAGLTGAGSSAPVSLGSQYFTDMGHAMSLNPGEPKYPSAEATALVTAAQSGGQSTSSTQARTYILQARGLLEKAVAEQPLAGSYAATLAEADMALSHLQPSKAPTYLAAALKAVHQALRDDPRNSNYKAVLAEIQTARHQAHKAASKKPGKG